jgi:hypothetical protein
VPLPVGPQITFFGVASADNRVKTPDAFSNDGVPIYVRPLPRNFIIVLEGRPGMANRPVNNCGVRNQFDAIIPCTSSDRAAVQVQANRPLGNGGGAVCDLDAPNGDGVPAVNPPDFGPAQAVTNAINDLACRFDDHSNNENSCTFDVLGNFRFVNPLSAGRRRRHRAAAGRHPLHRPAARR